MTIAVPSIVTPEHLDNLPNAVDYELLNGILVERHLGSESSAVAALIGSILLEWVKRTRAGHLFTADCGYRCFPDDPNRVRKPDVSFVARGRLPNERPPEGYIRIAPDLAVEVLSPGDLAYEVDEKVAEYLAAGFRLIWVVNPRTKIVRIHRPAGASLGPISSLAAADIISGEDVLSGFESPVSEFFDI